MKRYKILTILFNLLAICLFITSIVIISSGKGEPSTGLLLSCCGFTLLAGGRHFSKKQSELEKSEEASPTEEPVIDEPTLEEPEDIIPTPTAVRAEVVDMICGTGMMPIIGHKTPKAVRYFLIKFRTDDGHELEFDVEEEIYQGFDKGMTGTLTYVGEDIYGFEPEN